MSLLLSIITRIRSILGLRSSEPFVVRAGKAFEATGYTNMKDPILLIEACCQVFGNETLWPKGDETYCNFAVQDVAHYFGCLELDDKTADEMCSFMETSQSWQEIPMKDAQFTANHGSLVIAAATSQVLGQKHGHVCVIRPGQEKYSGHWDQSAPACMNLGRAGTCSISKTVNYAFVPEPRFFVWKNSL